MEQSSEQFFNWENNFIKIIQSKRLIGHDEELEFKNFIRNIESFNSLPPPYEKQTIHFLNVFSPQVINYILGIHSLSTEVEVVYETILRQYSQILGQQLTINKEIDDNTKMDDLTSNKPFIEAALKIIQSKDSKFYLLSEKIKTKTGRDPENYITNCHVFATTENLELFTQFIQAPTMKSLSKIERIIQILFPMSYLFDLEKLDVLIQIAASKIWELISKENPRKLNITEIENTLVSLEKMTSSSTVRLDVWKIQIDFSIKILKSGILTNMFSSLSTICRICQESPEQISPILRDENLLNYLLLKPTISGSSNYLDKLNPDNASNNDESIIGEINKDDNEQAAQNEIEDETNQNNQKETVNNEADTEKVNNLNDTEKYQENNEKEKSDNSNDSEKVSNLNNTEKEKSDNSNDSEKVSNLNNTEKEKSDNSNDSEKVNNLNSTEKVDNSGDAEKIHGDLENDDSVNRVSLVSKQSFFDDDIHFELINYIADIFSMMYLCRCATDVQLKTLWLKTISQSQTIIGTFLTAMESILSKIPKDSFFNMIIETNRYPESILPFLRSISTQCPTQSKIPIFNEIHELFFSGKTFSNEMENFLIDTMLGYIVDNDPNFCHKLQEECLNYIKSDTHINYSLKILQNALFFMTSEKAHDAFDTIMNKLNKDSIEYLDLIVKILKKLGSKINQDDFMALQKKTSEMIPDHSKDVCNFYQKLIDSFDILSDDLILAIYNNFCSLPFNANVFEMIKKMYFQLNNSIEKIESIWNHLFHTNRPEVSSFLISIYAKLKDHDKAEKFISNCLKNLHCVGSLEAIRSIIHVMEDGVESKENLTQNRMIFSFDLYKVNLTYLDNEPIKIKVTKDICYEGFKRTVINTLKLKEKSDTSKNPYSKKKPLNVLLYDNSTLFNRDNFKLYDDINISVHLTDSAFKEIDYFYDDDDILPSQVLIRQNYCSPIFDILLENDSELSPIALNIFNIIPTLPSQIIELNSITTENSIEKFLCADHPYLLVYRAHIIGNVVLKDGKADQYLDINVHDFLNTFYNSGGVECLLHVIFNFASSEFPANYCTEDLLRIAKCVLMNDSFHDNVNSSIEKVKDKIGTFLQWAIKVANEHNDSLLADITLFMKELTNYVVNFDEFSEVVQLTIFHKLPEIRTNISEIVNSIESVSSREKLIVPLLQKQAKTSKCEEYFDILTNIVKLTENPFNLYKAVIDCLYKNFTMPKKGTTLDILMFQPPPLNYTHAIFKELNILICRLNNNSNNGNSDEIEVEGAEELFKFLTNEIIFNPYKYYQPTIDLFEVYLTLLEKFSQFIQFLEPIVKQIEDFKLSPKSTTSISATARNRGIKNLGATCYMNSTIQQLFNIREFVRQILEPTVQSDPTAKDWFFELQYDFAKLWLFPSNFINISNFVSCWRGYDSEPVDLHRQQDSAEFLQLLIDRLEEKVPGISSIFTGKIEHRTVGVSVEYEKKNYETFVIFPLEVKNLTKLSDSFQSFLQPDRFECKDEELGKFDALRYHHIVEAPKILIIQLKRFNYNLMTRGREKINSFYQFSLDLDLSQLMTGNDQQKVNYDLCGVVQHQGSVDSGHYFSDVLRESGKWLCLNDNKVTKINGDDLPFEAAGGTEEKTVYDEKTKSSKKITAEKSTNAYLLFYRLREGDSQSGSEKEKIVLNSKTMDELLPDIQKAVFEAVCASPHFFKLVLKLCENGQNNEFLYKYTLNTLRISNNQEAAETLVSECIGICASNQNFSDFILKRESDLSEFIVFMKFAKVRKYYISIVEAALNNCSKDAFQEFYSYLVVQIKESNNVLYEMNKCIPEFFEVVNLTVINDSKFNVINSLDLIEILLTFSVDSIKNYDSKRKSENIFKKANLASVFDLILKLCKEKVTSTESIESVKKEISSRMFESSIFTALTVSQNHCNNLSKLLEFSLLNNNEGKTLFYSYVSDDRNGKRMPIRSIALLMNLSMTISDQSLIDLFFDILKTKSGTDIVLFFTSLEPICHSNRNIFMFNAQIWISSFLLSSNISVRASLVNFIYKMFSDVINESKDKKKVVDENARGVIINIYQNLIDSVPLLIQSLTNLKRKSQNGAVNDDNIPTEEFFEILTWSVEMVQMKDKSDIQIFVTFLSTLDEILRNIPNISASVSQFHCLQYLVKLYGKQLFATVSPSTVVTPLNNSCKTINRNHEEVLLLINDLLINVLPRFSICYLKSKLFNYLVMNNFNSDASNFVKENLNKETVGLITTVLWSQNVFRKNCRNFLYLQTSWRIIELYNDTCEVIYDQQDYLLLLKLINNNSSIQRTAAKFLAEFNFAYEKVNKNKKFFISLKTKTLYKKYKENGFKWQIIYDHAYNNRHMISPGNGGLCQFMRSMIALKTNPPQKLLSLISKSPKPFITTVIPTVQAAQLVCELCVAFPDSGEAINCLIHEFSSINSCYKIVEIFCEAFAKMKRKNFWMDLQKPLKEIFLKSDDVEVAGETVLRMSEQLFDRNTLIEFRNKVLELMVDEIHRIIIELSSTTSTKIMQKEFNKLKMGYDFIADITSTIRDGEIPQLKITKEESEKLIEIFKEHKLILSTDSFTMYVSKK